MKWNISEAYSTFQHSKHEIQKIHRPNNKFDGQKFNPCPTEQSPSGSLSRLWIHKGGARRQGNLRPRIRIYQQGGLEPDRNWNGGGVPYYIETNGRDVCSEVRLVGSGFFTRNGDGSRKRRRESERVEVKGPRGQRPEATAPSVHSAVRSDVENIVASTIHRLLPVPGPLAQTPTWGSFGSPVANNSPNPPGVNVP